jgi:3-dehydroquinate synthetase
VPHGTAVAFGILVENQISHNRQLLEHSQLTQMFQLGRSLIPDQTWQLIQDLDPNKLLPYLSNDKKAEGNILKIASLVRLGDMKFLDLPLDSLGLAELVTAFGQVIDQ